MSADAPSVPADGGNPYLAGLDPAVLTTCDREPIHRPGSIQPHGVLLVVDHGRIVAASANAGALIEVAGGVLGRSVAEVVGDGVAQWLGAEQAADDPMAPGGSHQVLELGGRVVDAVVRPAQVDAVPGDRWLLELEPRPAGPEHDHGSRFTAQLGEVLAGLERIDDLGSLLPFAATTLRRLTGYDRVMVYRFAPDGSGTVVAERHGAGLEPLLGLHYPATDIPQQARQMYLQSWLRMIVDIDADPVPIEPGFTGDLTRSVLRSAAPVHLQYLRNMGVQATLVLSLIVDDALWGLIACHHYGRSRQLTPPLRAAGELLARLLSLQIGSLEARSRDARLGELGQRHGRLLGRLTGAEDLARELALAEDELLGLADAAGVLVRLEGHTAVYGEVPDPATADALVAEVVRSARPLVCDHLGAIEPVATAAERGGGASLGELAGVLGVPVGERTGDALLWFRREQVAEVTWAGRPDKPDAGEVLTPRASFDSWSETVRGRCVPFDEVAVTAASRFADALPELLRQRAQQALEHLEVHDQLTGLPNRRYLTEQLEQTLARRDRSDPAMALLLVGIDRFRTVNDLAGHRVGDEVLRHTAARLVAATRSNDLVVRAGGDEFAVLCDQLELADEAELIADRIAARLRVPFVVAGRELRLTASIGIAEAAPTTTPTELLRAGDAALAQAKAAGRDATAVYDAAQREQQRRDEQIAAELGLALERRELRFHLQPIMDLATGRAVSLEALVRWQHPQRGLLAPGAFLAVAEARGLVPELSAVVLRGALRWLARSSAPWLADLTVAVNVAAEQLVSPGFRELVLGELDRHRIATDRLVLEITEHALVERMDETLPVLQGLRAAGVGLAVDDFGTGYSSLAYLRHLPLTELKIDRSFVQGLDSSRADRAVVGSLVGLADELGLRVVAEGIETPQQLAAVRELGIARGQGFLFARPTPPEVLEEGGPPLVG